MWFQMSEVDLGVIAIKKWLFNRIEVSQPDVKCHTQNILRMLCIMAIIIIRKWNCQPVQILDEAVCISFHLHKGKLWKGVGERERERNFLNMQTGEKIYNSSQAKPT